MGGVTAIHCHGLPDAVAVAIRRAADALSLRGGDGLDEVTGDDVVVLYGPEALGHLERLRRGALPPRVLVLADAGGRPTRAEAARAGADDWLPSTIAEQAVAPRLRALAHLEGASGHALRLPGCWVDLSTGTVRRADGATARLTVQERRLLERLAQTPGVPVDRDTLLVEVWEYHPEIVSRAPDVAVRRLRTKIELDASDPQLVRTHPGEGWSLVPFARDVVSIGPVVRPDDPAFVGREEVLATIDGAWAAGTRVVVLVGPPGVGKSRLARRAAAGGRRPWVDVRLQGARTREDVLVALATALGVGAADDDPTAFAERLGRLAGARRALVCLDPADDVVDEVAELLDGWGEVADGAAWLVCSRERLRVADAAEVAVGPLPRADAASLFRARARATGWSETVADDELLTVVDALDGLPLAIELAAGRLRTLGLAGLSDDEGVRLDRLTSPRRGAGDGSTLEDAIAASWERLGPRLQTVLACVGEMPDGLDLAMVQAICPPDDDRGAWVGDALHALEDRSLLQVRQTAGGPRYEVLDAIRWYARRHRTPAFGRALAERIVAWALACDAEASGVQATNLRHALVLARDLEPRTLAEVTLHVDDLLCDTAPSSERAAWLALALDGTLPAELALELRLRAANVAWALVLPGARDAVLDVREEARAAGCDEVYVRATVAAARIARRHEGVTAADAFGLETLLDDVEAPALRLEILVERAREHGDGGRWGAAQSCLDRAMAVDRVHGLGERRELLGLAARLALESGEGERALEASREILATADARAEARSVQGAWHYQGLGLLLLRRLDDATSAFEAALGLAEDLGLRREEAVALGNLGILYAELGDTREARRTLRRAAALHTELRQARSATMAMVNLAIIRLVDDDPLAVVDDLLAAIERGEARAWPALTVVARYILGLAWLLGPTPDDAAAPLRAAVEASERLGLWHVAAPAAAHLARRSTSLGDPEATSWWARAEQAAARAKLPEVGATLAVLRGGAPPEADVHPLEVRLALRVVGTA